MRILIVDDDSSTRCLLSGLFEQYGSCDAVTNGEEAVEAVRLSLEDNKPYDLIFLDIVMPKMNGQEALIKIRRMEEDKEIWLGGSGAKIIMTSVLSDGKSIMKAFKRCEAYLVKPITIEKLNTILKDLKVGNCF